MSAKGHEERAEPSRQMPAMTPEDREQQMIALADSLAEKQLRDGSASSQVMTHYLKMGTSMYQFELEKIRRENLLLEQKANLMASQQRADEMMEEVFSAIRRYSGADDDEEGQYVA